MNRIEKAVQNKQNGYNCAQSVVCAYAQMFNMSEEDAYRISEGFGSGMGGLQLTCGAVTGMMMVIGLMNSNAVLGDKETRPSTYKLIREAVASFEELNQSSECKVLLNSERVKLRSCSGCVEDCAIYLEKLIHESVPNIETINS